MNKKFNMYRVTQGNLNPSNPSNLVLQLPRIRSTPTYRRSMATLAPASPSPRGRRRRSRQREETLPWVWTLPPPQGISWLWFLLLLSLLLLLWGSVLQKAGWAGKRRLPLRKSFHIRIWDFHRRRLQKLWDFSTLWGVHSVVKFCFVSDRKFQLPSGLHSSCSIPPAAMASGL